MPIDVPDGGGNSGEFADDSHVPAHWRDNYLRRAVTGPNGAQVYLFRRRDRDYAFDVNGLYVHTLRGEQLRLLTQIDPETLTIPSPTGPAAADAEKLRQLIDRGELFAPFVLRESKVEPVSGAFIYVTNACNLDCPYCYREYNTRKLSFECATDNVDKAATDARKRGRKILNVRFIGGEPLMNIKLIDELVQYYRMKGRMDGMEYRFSVVTNGTLLDKKNVDLLWKHRVMVTISFGGADQATHDKTRPVLKGGWSSYEQILRNLPYLFKVYGAENVWTNNTITREYYDYWRIFKHSLDLGFKRIKMNHVQSDRNSAFNWHDLPRVTERRSEFLARYLGYLLKGGDAVSFREQMRLKSLHLREHSIVPGPCGTNTTLAFNTDGNLYNCQRFIGMPGMRVGTQEGGYDAARLAPLIANTVETKGTCSVCWAKYMCGGSCPHARADLDDTQELIETLDGWDEYCKRTYNEWEAAIWFYVELRERAPQILEWLVFGRRGDTELDRNADLFLPARG